MPLSYATHAIFCRVGTHVQKYYDRIRGSRTEGKREWIGYREVNLCNYLNEIVYFSKKYKYLVFAQKKSILCKYWISKRKPTFVVVFKNELFDIWILIGATLFFCMNWPIFTYVQHSVPQSRKTSFSGDANQLGSILLPWTVVKELSEKSSPGACIKNFKANLDSLNWKISLRIW